MGKAESQPSIRMQHRFWFDIQREDERLLDEYVINLKEKRSFAKTIRDALRLIKDLRAGNVDMLITLFPWIPAYFEAPTKANNSGSPDNSGNHDLKAVKAHLERLEQALLADRSQSAWQAQSTLPASIPDTLPEFEITVKKSDKIPSYEIILAGAMFKGSYDKLPKEVILYGIKMGKIPQDKIPAAYRENSESAPILPAVAAAENQKQGKANRFSWGKK